MPPRKTANAVSDYESQRQANIAKNQALLKELQLNAASAGIAPKSKPKNATGTQSAPKKKPAPRRVKEEDVQPRRTSSRLQGIVADSEVAKRKAEEDRQVIEEQNRIKRMRRSDDLELGDIVVAGKEWNKSGNFLRDVRPANPYERTFDEDDIKNTPDKELREMREKMSNLSLWEDVEPARIKITPERIYAMGFHPTSAKPLVFAGDKLGNLGLFDGSQEISRDVKEEDDDGEEELNDHSTPDITTFKIHTRTISSIHFTPSQPEALYTASYDSSIRKLDLNKQVAVEAYGPESNDIDDPLSGISIPIPSPQLLYFTSLHGSFGIHDTRASKSEATQLMQLSDKKIGGFSVHPLHPHLLATASLDRTLKLWDLRKISGKGENRLPALLAEHDSKLSVSHAAFNAAGQIATSSYDDTIKIHDLPGTGEPSAMPAGKALGEGKFKPATVIPHNNQTGRWVTILRPYWQATPQSGPQKFVIGNMNRFVDVYAGTGEQLAQLGGDGITAVPAVACFHDSQDWIAGGTASGKLALWI
ncbi:MAG: hypothetical protein Q9159_003215 [Coniocarpon cinnabarinum]